MKDEKAKTPAPKRLKKPNIAVRVLALTVTAALVLGALVLCTASLVDAGYNPFLYFRF